MSYVGFAGGFNFVTAIINQICTLLVSFCPTEVQTYVKKSISNCFTNINQYYFVHL